MGPAPGALQYLYNSKSGQACKAESRHPYCAHNPSPSQGYVCPPLPICCPTYVKHKHPAATVKVHPNINYTNTEQK